MTKFLVFLAAGVLALILRSILFFLVPIQGCIPDLVLIHVVYLGIFRNPVRGVLIAFLLGYLSDLAAGGGYPGLSSLVYLALFLAARLAGRVFYARNPWIQVIITAIISMAYALMVHWILRGFGVLPGAWPGDMVRPAVQAAVSGAFAPLIFWVLFHVERLSSSERLGSEGFSRETPGEDRWSR